MADPQHTRRKPARKGLLAQPCLAAECSLDHLEERLGNFHVVGEALDQRRAARFDRVEADFVGFPLGVTAGAYDFTFDLSAATSWNLAFITANGGSPASAEAALLAGLDSERAYLNIHTAQFPGGEIRGFLSRDVPEPAVPALLGMAAVAALASSRRP